MSSALSGITSSLAISQSDSSGIDQHSHGFHARGRRGSPIDFGTARQRFDNGRASAEPKSPRCSSVKQPRARGPGAQGAQGRITTMDITARHADQADGTSQAQTLTRRSGLDVGSAIANRLDRAIGAAK